MLSAWADDLGAIVATLAAVTALVALAEGLSARGMRGEHTRKLVHVLGGLWCLGLPFMAEHLATLALLAAIIASVFETARRTGRLKGLHSVGRSGSGPTLFPLGVLAASALTWEHRELYVGAVLVLTLGDAAAALVGERVGHLRYAAGPGSRSVEGSAAMFAVAAVVGAGTLVVAGLPWGASVACGLVLAFVATALEGVSPLGLDNVTVPLGSAAFLRLVDAGADAGLLAVAVVVPGLVAALSVKRRNVTASGALAVWLLGFTLVVGGGFGWFLASLLVFVAVNVASRLKRAGADKPFQAKGATRDHLQILANAGLAIPAAAGWGATGHPAFLGAFLGALAFAGADTLASEIGVLSRVQPIAITTWKPVPSGTSGGVTPLGYGAAALGSAVPALGLALGTLTPQPLWLGVALVAGLAGCTADSLLGDLGQARFWCPGCGAVTESATHCGQPGEHRSGVAWMDNDAVNLLGSTVSAVVGAGLAWGWL